MICPLPKEKKAEFVAWVAEVIATELGVMHETVGKIGTGFAAFPPP